MIDRADLHARIDIDRVVERTSEMIRIPSVNPFEKEEFDRGEGEVVIGEWLSARLDELGYEPQAHEVAPGRPNVWGTSPGGDGPVIALGGHIDTVGVDGYGGDPFSGTVADGKVSGRGACDMKGAFACFLEVAEVLKASNTELVGRLMIAGLADEEAGMLGSARFGDAAKAPDFAILGEPTELAICTSHLGQYAFPIKTFGRAVHSSIYYEGINAIEKMMRVMATLGQYRDELALRDPHPMCGVGTVNAGVIRGGNMVSIVPDWCTIDVDRRLTPGETSASAREEIEARLEALYANDPEFEYELGEPLVDAAPLDTPLDSPVVLAAQQAAAQWGSSAEAMSFTGSTDAPNLGVPAIIWGPGSLTQAHTTNEWVSVEQLEAAAHMYLDAVLEIAG